MSKYFNEDGQEISWKELIHEDEKTVENDKVCLITGKPLTDYYVKMDCGHTFNYVPLFKDLVNQKTKFNKLSMIRLAINELLCPYCRKRQKQLIPYYDIPGIEKVHGVNFIDIDVINNNHKTPYKSGVSVGGGFISGGGGFCCYYKKMVANNISEYTYECPNLFGYTGTDGKSYCYIHNKIIEKQKKKEAKQEEKKKLMEEKKKQKEKEKEEKKNVGENEVICQTILKTGKRVGQVCGQKSVESNCCLRHYNLQNKKK